MDPQSLDKLGQGNGLWYWNLKARKIHFSPGWVAMLGFEPHEVGNTPEELFQRLHPEDLIRVQSEVDATLAGKSTQFISQHRLLHKEGTYRWMSCRGVVSRNKKGQPVRLAGFHTDVTAENAADALTGLPKRLPFLDRLEGSIERAIDDHDYAFSVLLLDIDHFSSVAERLGPKDADQLLIAVARRLETSLGAGADPVRQGSGHVAARFGGDEFAILLDNLAEATEARSIAERMLAEVSAAFELAGQQISLSASVGIALSLSGYTRSEDALCDAGTALSRAKSVGPGHCEVFGMEVLDTVDTRPRLEDDLYEAMARNELSLTYQPVASLVSNQIVGFEALVRWNHPQRGVVPAADFNPVAERSGLIIPLGRWVLYEAGQQLKKWQSQLKVPPELWVAVNFSPLQLKQPSLARQLGEILRDIDLDPRCLTLELTEKAVTEDPKAIGSLLMQLRALGVKIALDELGTGPSSLSYLHQFPVDFLKIDHSFLRRMETSKDLAEFTRTIGSLTHHLSLRVIAEGIESKEQLPLVHSLNCEYGQGHLFSRPVDSRQAGVLLKTGLPQRYSRESSNKQAEDDTAEAFLSSQDDVRPSDTGLLAGWRLIGQAYATVCRKVGTALAVSCAAIVLLAGIAIIRFTGRASPSATGKAHPVLQDTTEEPAPAAAVQEPAGGTALQPRQTQPVKASTKQPSPVHSKPPRTDEKKRSSVRPEAGDAPAGAGRQATP